MLQQGIPVNWDPLNQSNWMEDGWLAGQLAISLQDNHSRLLRGERYSLTIRHASAQTFDSGYSYNAEALKHAREQVNTGVLNFKTHSGTDSIHFIKKR